MCKSYTWGPWFILVQQQVLSQKRRPPSNADLAGTQVRLVRICSVRAVAGPTLLPASAAIWLAPCAACAIWFRGAFLSARIPCHTILDNEMLATSSASVQYSQLLVMISAHLFFRSACCQADLAFSSGPVWTPPEVVPHGGSQRKIIIFEVHARHTPRYPEQHPTQTCPTCRMRACASWPGNTAAQEQLQLAPNQTGPASCQAHAATHTAQQCQVSSPWPGTSAWHKPTTSCRVLYLHGFRCGGQLPPRTAYYTHELLWRGHCACGG